MSRKEESRLLTLGLEDPGRTNILVFIEIKINNPHTKYRYNSGARVPPLPRRKFSR
jgi:hypothetical protein